MAITIRDAKAAPRQRNIASLVGGFVIAFGCFVLFVLVASQLTQWPPSPLLWVLGALVAVAIGVWIRVADL
jgi:lipopolysaccharide export LptBFGC system permease protein LptF